MYRLSILLAFLTLLPSSDAMPQQSLERTFRGYTQSPKYILAKPRPKQWTLGSSSPSRNAPQPIPSDSPYTDKGVQLVVRPQESELFREEYEGFAILLVNAASYDVSLGRCYRCLPIHREALDPDGVWEEIEFLDCPNGDGYSAVDILPGQYYRFAAPRLAGTYQTWMRFRLGSYIFSNEFYGTMDRDQFRCLPNASNLHEISAEDLERLPVDNLRDAVGLLPGVVVTGGHPR
jgi:hypothetical protein